MAAETIIHLDHISKNFNGHQALLDVELKIFHGEFLTLLGPSGCGKTTLLRTIAGFATPDKGHVFLKNQDITSVPPELRHINMVFQSYALFPHMTVRENVAFGLKCHHIPAAEINTRVDQALQRVKLQHLAQRKPQQLSGGQQQRVAIARAVVNEPLVLLLDEPLSALDYHLRCEMRLELKALQRRLGITFVLVTHDQEEALSLSDRVVVMNHGAIEQIGTPRDIYEEPKNTYVAKFIGAANLLQTSVLAVDIARKKMTIEICGIQFEIDNKKNNRLGDAIHLIIRPEDIEVWGIDELDRTPGLIPATVHEVIYKGSTVDLIVKLPTGQLVAATAFFDEDDDKLEYQLNENVLVRWKLGWEVVLPSEENAKND